MIEAYLKHEAVPHPLLRRLERARPAIHVVVKRFQMEDPMGTKVKRTVAIASALLVSACGGGEGGAGGRATLFNEEFSTAGGGASNLANSWIVTSSSTCTASNTDQDVLGSLPQGNPTSGLVLKCQGATVASPLGLRSIDTYILNSPLTFAVDARVDSVGTFGGNPQPGMNFSLLALNTGAVFSQVALRQNSATFLMKSGGTFVQVTRTFSADALFHRYVFVVDGKGNAEWLRDGALQANTPNFPTNTGNLYVMMQAPPSTDTESSEGHFDNVRVTAP